MGFDLITLAMAKAYADSKSIRTEKMQVNVVPKAELDQWDKIGDPMTAIVVQEMFVEGDTYLVTTDSGKFTAVCKSALADGVEVTFVGNGTKMELEDTGESFLAVTMAHPEVGVMCLAFDYNNGTFIEVSKVVETIDPKYLPGVCLPVVELSTVATAEGAALTAEESERMDEVAAKGVPIICSCKLVVDEHLFESSLNMNIVFSQYSVFISPNRVLQLAKKENNWEIKIEEVLE